MEKGTAKNVPCAHCGALFRLTAFWFARGKRACSFACRDALKRAETYNDELRTKKCSRCAQWKPFEDYAPSAGKKAAKNGGLQAYCNACAYEVNAQFRRDNRERRRDSARRFYERHAEKCREAARNLTPEQRQSKNARQIEYRKANMPTVLMLNRLRRHRERAAGAMPSRNEILTLLREQNEQCPYCGCQLSAGYHIDHKTPVSRGGTNDISNLQILCVPCNLRKSSKTDEEFRALLDA